MSSEHGLQPLWVIKCLFLSRGYKGGDIQYLLILDSALSSSGAGVCLWLKTCKGKYHSPRLLHHGGVMVTATGLDKWGN